MADPRSRGRGSSAPRGPSAHRGGGAPRGRSGHSGGEGRGGHAGERERPKKENILNLGRFMDQRVAVKFGGGREVTGSLKGYDALMNLVLDEVEEVVRDEESNETTRSLGLVVARGTLLVQLSPVDGSEAISNPFREEEEE